jgi:hypothetical protein
LADDAGGTGRELRLHAEEMLSLEREVRRLKKGTIEWLDAVERLKEHVDRGHELMQRAAAEIEELEAK